MSMTARFYVAEVSQYAASGGYADPAPGGRVVLRPALKDDGNAAWASATPSGEMQMTVRREAFLWWQERLGKTMHITFDDLPDTTEE